MIYIDPPYNTGRDFVYNDDFKDNISNYLRLIGDADETGIKFTNNPESSGRYHSNWLSMIIPRLHLARHFLSDDGAIFVSIDDGEQANLRKICDEIFGEENFITTITWEKRYSPQNAVQWFSEAHDFILVYAKFKEIWQPNLLERSEEMNARYRNLDDDPRGLWKATDATAQAGHGTASQFYELTCPNGQVYQPPTGRCWVYTQDRMQEMIADNRVWFGSDGKSAPAIKRFLTEVKQGVACQTIWKYEHVGHNQEGKKEIKALFPEAVLFDTPKPTRLVDRILKLATHNDSIVLDFFSGSATTAHAVMQLNKEDNGDRRFILVQLPELCDDNSEASKAGYKNIAEIGKERIRRVIRKIKTEHPDYTGDLGFRVFKLDSSNIRLWNPDTANIAGSLLAYTDNVLPDRTEQDLLYEVLLKFGLDLTSPMLEKSFAGHTVYSLGQGVLFACLSKTIASADVESIGLGIANWRKETLPAGESTVIFRDSAFAGDVAKANMTAILQQHGIDNVRSL